MDTIILAVETSCDETAIAILKNEKELLSNVVATQISDHEKTGGVIPELASRLHVEAISHVLDEAITKANIKREDIDAIAFTRGPGLIGSLHIGTICAKTIALALNKPIIGVHHIAGHIYANNLIKDLKFPLLALVVSGGHTELIYMKEHLSFEILGTTLDDAVGEAYDKVARILNLGYPGGPKIDNLAKLGKPNYKLPIPMNDKSLNFSFSGLKSAVINLTHNEKQRGNEINNEDLACSFQTIAIKSLINKSVLAIDQLDIKQFVLAGGVSANSYLREEVTKMIDNYSDIDLILPPLWCCTDNAAMIASAGYFMYKKELFDNLDIGAKPSLPLNRI